MRIKTLLRAVHGKRLSEAKDWKTAEAKFNQAVSDLKIARQAVKKDCLEVQTMLQRVQSYSDGVSQQIGDLASEMIDDKGYSGMDPRVSAIEDLQSECETFDEYVHDTVYSLEHITNRVPAVPKWRSKSTTKAALKSELAAGRTLARQAYKKLKDVQAQFEKAHNKAYEAFDGLPDDDDARTDRLEGKIDPNQEIDDIIDALDYAERTMTWLF